MSKHQKGIYRSGTSGMVFTEANKLAFPAEFRDKSRLVYYASLYNTLEVNSSFYKVPMGKTVAAWAESVPEGFEFTFKLWKGITHCKGFVPRMEDIDHFMNVISYAGDKKGCLLIQLPPSVTIAGAEQLEKVFNQVKQYGGWKTAIEFRHPSWYQADVFALADKYDTNVVLHDMPASYNMQFNKKATFVYWRFHGPAGDYKGGYPDELLLDHSRKVNLWLMEGKDVYVYFNNTIGDAIKNTVTLRNFVRS